MTCCLTLVGGVSARWAVTGRGRGSCAPAASDQALLGGPSTWALHAMNKLLPLAVCLAFVGLALWHFYMALVAASGVTGAVPSVEGKPVFVPTRRATVGVGVVLLLFAVLVAGTGGMVSVGLPAVALSWLSYALAFGLLARAIGEFRYVGFFKRVRGTKFARLDTLLYSPLCLLLAVAVALVAWRHGT